MADDAVFAQHHPMKKNLAEYSRTVRIGVALGGVLVLALALGEALGWPFLAEPVQQSLEGALGRRVRLGAESSASPEVHIRLLGGVRISTPHLEIGAPVWSVSPYLLSAQQADLRLAYADLWRAYRGLPLRVRALSAKALDVRLERLADGRATWQLGTARPEPTAGEVPRLPHVDRLQVDAGALSLRDAVQAVDAEATFSFIDGAAKGASAPAAGLLLQATGSYRKLPLAVEMRATGVLQAANGTRAAQAIPVKLDAHVGHTRLTFRGTATDALRLTELQGLYTMSGPSLAAVGDPFGITLPTTAAFSTRGAVAKQGEVWNVVVTQATVGSSRLGGAFTFDPRPRTPELAGRLTGSRLVLADLGPSLGMPVVVAPSEPPADAALATTAKARRSGRVLPDRPFDLPALRAMNANVMVDIESVDLGSRLLEPLKPLRTQVVLRDGVLALRDLDARTGQGRLAGMVQLDGRNALALWTADLRWDGVRLESWIHQARTAGAPPYLSGAMAGQARMAGQGVSTATILGSLRGGVRMQVADGRISHLAVEAAGLDVAQGLGMLLKGDDSLPVQCFVADMVAEQGLLRPRLLVLDTTDSTLWLDGSLSMATEALDMQVHVAPKDFSPLALRTPIHLGGSFADPVVSLDKAGIGARLGAAALLGLVNPLAALIPFIDAGSSAEADRGAAGCAQLSRRIKAQPRLAASPAAQAKAAAAPR